MFRHLFQSNHDLEALDAICKGFITTSMYTLGEKNDLNIYLNAL